MFKHEFNHEDAKYYVYFNEEKLDKLGGFTHPRYATAAIEQLKKDLKDGKSGQDKPKGKPKVSKEIEPEIKEENSIS